MTLAFASICDLLEQLEAAGYESRPADTDKGRERQRAAALEWFQCHRDAVDAPGERRIALLSCLFPERHSDRVYNIKAPSLLNILSRCLGLGASRLDELRSWRTRPGYDIASWTARIVSATDIPEHTSSFTILDIDKTLAILAAQCRFSSLEARMRIKEDGTKPAHEVLGPILRQLPSKELKWFIRLVLKDFLPLVLEENFILKQIHCMLPQLLRFQSTFAAASALIDEHRLVNLHGDTAEGQDGILSTPERAAVLRPKTGVKIGRPTFIKARSVKHCLQVVSNGRWALEPKYDGEYCQLHIDLALGHNCIKLFAKSGKDATQDRKGVHDWIRKCLKIGTPQCKFKQRCILEGELVVISSIDNTILPFHTIRKHVLRSGLALGTELDSQIHDHESLMIVFYDALLIDDEVTMALPYCKRRRRLSELLDHADGLLNRSNWAQINFSKLLPEQREKLLRTKLVEAVVQRCEGLILKPDDSPYFSVSAKSRGNSGKIVKLKADYIHGLGDSLDFAVVGATRDLKAAGSLTAKWTHFIIACLENKDKAVRFGSRPRYRVMDSLSRPCVSVEDMMFLTHHGGFVAEPYSAAREPSSFDLCVSQDQRIDVVFTRPFIVEVLGSSFHRPSSTRHYMLRHPRITKVHGDRGLEDVVAFGELQRLAERALKQPEDCSAERSAWLDKVLEHSRNKHTRIANTASTKSPLSSASANSACSTRPRRGRGVAAPLVRMDTQDLSFRVNAIVSQQNLLLNPRTAAEVSNEAPPETSRLPLTVSRSVLAMPPASGRDQIAGQLQRDPLTEIEANSDSRINTTTSDSTNKAQQLQVKEAIAATGCVAQVSKTVNASGSPSRKRQIESEATRMCEPSSRKHLRIDAARIYSAMALQSDKLRHNDTTRDKSRPHLRNRPETGESIPLPIERLSGTSEAFTTTPTSPFPIEHAAMPGVEDGSLAAIDDLAMSQSDPAPSHPASLRSVALCLSPCVRRHPYLAETLLPAARPGHATGTLAHWARELPHAASAGPDPPDSTALAPARIGESQAFAGLQKAVLVEARRAAETCAFLARVAREVDLVRERGERIFVYDWRLLEALTSSAAGPGETCEQDSPARAARAFAAAHCATIRWSGRLGANEVVWASAAGSAAWRDGGRGI